MADSHPISLSTGEKVYYLDYPFDYKAFLSSSDGREWKAFCTYLGNSSMLSSHAHAYYVNGLAPPRRISRQLLLEDGFALGRICGERHGFGTDGEADPTHYAVFERCSSESQERVPGEYAVVLLPSLKAFNAYNEQRFPPHRILRLRVMCMYLPLFMPHVDDMQRFSLIGQGSFGAAFRVQYHRPTPSLHSNRASPPPSPDHSHPSSDPSDLNPDPSHARAPPDEPPLTCVIKRADIERRSFKLVMRESWFLRQLRHPNIARLLHQYVSPNSAPSDRSPTSYFVQEDCGATLRAYMRNRLVSKQPVPLETVESVLHGLLSALVCLEHHGILHRDIKDDNCLIFGQEPLVTAKLIDFGLAKKFDQDGLNVPVLDGLNIPVLDGLNIPVLDGAAPQDAAAEEWDDQSKLFKGETQYAPETLGKEELGLPRQFVHKSDLWAVGTMILYPLLFWSRESKVKLYGEMSESARLKAIRFPFEELWGGVVTPGKKAIPKPYSQSDLRKVIREQLGFLDGQDPLPYGAEPRFERLCHILEQMCAHNPDDRSTAQQCLALLTHPTPPPAAEAPAAAEQPFNYVCKFIDKFCASGHFRGSASKLSSASGDAVAVEFDFTLPARQALALPPKQKMCVTYKRLQAEPSWPERMFRWEEWLLVRDPIIIADVPSAALTYVDCLKPDFYVQPPQALVHGNAPPRAIFLPRNLFCYGVPVPGVAGDRPGMLDVCGLSLVIQRDWFTVFRYQRPGLPPFIIKHTSLNSVTFKYLLQEKAMLSYLHHPRIANEIPQFKDFHPLVMFTDLDPVTRCDTPFTGNDRFVFYEDGGRPVDIQLQNGWRPCLLQTERIAKQLLEVLDYLRMKNVVHRKLSLGTVVCNPLRCDIKLVSLGDAKFVGALDYEQAAQEFARQWQGDKSVGASAAGGGKRSSSCKPERKEAETRNKTSKKYDCVAPMSRNEPPSFEHDWYSVGRILEILLQKLHPKIEPPHPEEVAERNLCQVAWLLQKKYVFCRQQRHADNLAQCMELLGCERAPHEDVSPGSSALLSFIQALLRRRFH